MATSTARLSSACGRRLTRTRQTFARGSISCWHLPLPLGEGPRVGARNVARRKSFTPTLSEGRGSENMFLFQVANPDVNLLLIAPELIVSVAGVIVMLVDAFTHRRQRNVTAALSILAMLGAGVASIWLWLKWPATSAFNGMIVLDELRLSFTVVFLIVAILTILIATIWLDVEDLPAGEFHSLLLFATTGMMLMASAGDLVIVFLGLEILSIATYVLAGFRRSDRRSNESSLKYFILGSF